MKKFFNKVYFGLLLRNHCHHCCLWCNHFEHCKEETLEDQMYENEANYKFVPKDSQMKDYFEILLSLGIKYKDKSFPMKTFLNVQALEAELNKLARYIFNDDRNVFFHEFRMFPYILHGLRSKPIPEDAMGLIHNYTYLDLRLIQLIKVFVTVKNEYYLFLDIDHFINNSEKYYIKDSPIQKIPIDQIYLIFARASRLSITKKN